MKRFLAVPIFRVKAHVGRTLGHLSSLDAHGHADVCLVQGWSVVHLGPVVWSLMC